MTKYVGRAPNTDVSVVTKSHADTRRNALKVDANYINSAVDAYAASNNLVNQAYVDAADLTRVKKTAVQAADSLYLSTTVRGVPNGVASTGATNYIPDDQLYALNGENPIGYVEGTIYLTGNQTVTNSATKTFLAGALTINDPGFAYRPLPFAYVRGFCPGVVDHSRRNGGAHRGKMTILSQDDTLYGGGCTAAHFGPTLYPVLPTVAQGATPSSVTGATTLSLWLALYSGTGYVFDSTGIKFFCLVFPAA
jgi:hypothetical protein